MLLLCGYKSPSCFFPAALLLAAQNSQALFQDVYLPFLSVCLLFQIVHSQRQRPYCLFLAFQLILQLLDYALFSSQVQQFSCIIGNQNILFFFICKNKKEMNFDHVVQRQSWKKTIKIISHLILYVHHHLMKQSLKNSGIKVLLSSSLGT